jgi:hypothetical protein
MAIIGVFHFLLRFAAIVHVGLQIAVAIVGFAS